MLPGFVGSAPPCNGALPNRNRDHASLAASLRVLHQRTMGNRSPSSLTSPPNLVSGFDPMDQRQIKAAVVHEDGNCIRALPR